MVLTTVMVKVKQMHIEDFKSACIKNHESSIKEPGNMRFDVLQSPEDPTSFMLYEAYDSAESAAAHKMTAHYSQWRDTVAAWMEIPRKGIPWNVIKP